MIRFTLNFFFEVFEETFTAGIVNKIPFFENNGTI